jgi:hypothetical protein
MGIGIRGRSFTFGRIAGILLAFALSLTAQVDVLVPGGGPFWTLAQNAAWATAGRGGLHNYYILTPRQPSAGVCVSVYNRDTATHQLYVVAYGSNNPSVYSWTSSPNEWSTLGAGLNYTDAIRADASAFPVVPANSTRRWWIPTYGASRIAVYPLLATTSGGTADIYATASDSPCVHVQSDFAVSTSATAGAATVYLTAALGSQTFVDGITAWCSAGTSRVTVTHGSVTLWQTAPAEVGTSTFSVAWTRGLPGYYYPDQNVTVTLDSCGTGNTGYLFVSYHLDWR